MLLAAFILAIGCGIGFGGLRPLLKAGQKKEAAVYVIFLAFSTAICVVAVRWEDIPSPLNAIRFVYKPVSDWFFYIFK